jgi:hypothetical protein
VRFRFLRPWCASAPSYGRIKHVGVTPIVVPELKFSDVQRHIFGADFVEASDDTALEDRPETLNRVRVDCADNVFLCAVVHDAVLVPILGQIVIRAVLIGREQANLVGDGFANERLSSGLGDAFQNAGNDIALAANRADDRGLATDAADDAALAAMLVDALAADVGLIDLDNPSKLWDSSGAQNARPVKRQIIAIADEFPPISARILPKLAAD